METGIHTTCNGTIAINGYCDQCGQVSQHSGFTCGRLIPVVPTDSSFKTAKAILREHLNAWDKGITDDDWNNPDAETKEGIEMVEQAMRAYAEQALDEMRDETLKKQSPLYYGDVLEFIEKVKNELK